LNNGYIRIPPGVYLGSQFTITVWIKLKLKRHFSRIIEFGNGPYSDNIELSFRETTSYVHLKTYFQNETKGFLDSSSALNLNEWTHVAACLCSGTAKLYFNGILVASGTQYSPRNFIRKHNFIGKGSFEGDENANAIFDDIKIFDECLNDYEIKEDADKSKILLKLLYFH
jgi:arabinan endo-1,5-alpha-L-arabinosidase